MNLAPYNSSAPVSVVTEYRTLGCEVLYAYQGTAVVGAFRFDWNDKAMCQTIAGYGTAAFMPAFRRLNEIVLKTDGKVESFSDLSAMTDHDVALRKGQHEYGSRHVLKMSRNHVLSGSKIVTMAATVVGMLLQNDHEVYGMSRRGAFEAALRRHGLPGDRPWEVQRARVA